MEGSSLHFSFGDYHDGKDHRTLPSSISEEQLVGAELYDILSLIAIPRPLNGPAI